MFPVLLQTKYLTIHTWGLFVAISFIFGVLFVIHEAKKEGIPAQFILDLWFVVFVGAIVGAKVLFIFSDYETFLIRPIRILQIWKGGLVFYGGFLGALIAGIWHTKRHKMSVFQVSDLCILVLPIGYAISRIGCFCAGCCYGKPTESSWGVVFNNPISFAPIGINIHPVQLYSAVINLCIFFILLRIKEHKKFDGQVIATYLVLYAISRFIIEFFRGDKRGAILMFSTSQLISLILLPVGLFIWNKARDQQP